MRILIAEDDETTAGFITRGAEELGHIVISTSTGDEALERMLAQAFDVIVLDRMLPGIDGLSLVRHARQAGIHTPILLLTALGRIEDRVDGLESGAEDYLTKPFALSELMARLNAIMRRKALGEGLMRFTTGALVVDILHREVRYEGRLIALQPRELRLLEELIRNAGRVVTRTMLLEAVWGFHFDPQTNLVETHMSRLRTKLALGGLKEAIETVRGVGYRLHIED